MAKKTKTQDIKPDTGHKYTLRELLKKKVNGERVLFLYNIAVICGVTSRQGVYDICDGKAVIFTNELRQIANDVTGYGLPITENDIDQSGLWVKEFG